MEKDVAMRASTVAGEKGGLVGGKKGSNDANGCKNQKAKEKEPTPRV